MLGLWRLHPEADSAQMAARPAPRSALHHAPIAWLETLGGAPVSFLATIRQRIDCRVSLLDGGDAGLLEAPEVLPLHTSHSKTAWLNELSVC